MRYLQSNLPPDEAAQKAREAALHAIALDDSLAEAHCSAAYIRFFKDWDFAVAEAEFRRALQLNPTSPRRTSGMRKCSPR